jgi:hypothetical protein
VAADAIDPPARISNTHTVMAEQYLRIVAPLNRGTNRCAMRGTAVRTGCVS